jgi:hypothetical protein
VGKLLTLRTVSLGVLSDTVLELYAANGTTLLATDDDGGEAFESLIAWTPSAAGTYYVKVKPFDADSNTENCGATYQFFVARTFVYIPSMSR